MYRWMTRRRSTGSLPALAVIGGLALLVVLFWAVGGATASGPLPDAPAAKRAAVAAKLETLHKALAARRVDADDDHDVGQPPAILPEQAVLQAQRYLSSHGGGQVLSVEQQTLPNGTAVYAVTVNTGNNGNGGGNTPNGNTPNANNTKVLFIHKLTGVVLP